MMRDQVSRYNTDTMSYQIHTIPAFSDNYLWLVEESASRKALVVDPGDAVPVLAALERLGLELAAILVTHHHPDHIVGIDALVAHCGCEVIGRASPRVPQVSRPVVDGDNPRVLGLTFEVIDVPGHTIDHIAYVSRDIGPHPALFCGDTLFAGGCGRLFEGSAEQMYHSLERLAALPPDTRVYCAHEYTLANLRFASLVEPGNPDLARRLADVIERRDHLQPTVPSTVADELATNPFLRCHLPSLRDAAARHAGSAPADPVETFAVVRRWKDQI